MLLAQVLLVGLAACQDDFGSRGVIVCVDRLKAEPKIDGQVLGDRGWAGSTYLPGVIPGKALFHVLGYPRQAPRARTDLHLGYTQRGIFVGFRCTLPEGAKIQAERRSPISRVWEDECVELFLSAYDEGRPYVHFVVNAAGSGFAELNRQGPESLKINWRWAAKIIDPQHWQAEIFIPWDGIPMPADAGAFWWGNFCRHCPAIQELSCYSPCKESFHEPENFVEIYFGDVNLLPFVRRQFSQHLAQLRQQASAVAGRCKQATRCGAQGRRMAERAAGRANQLIRELQAADREKLKQIESSMRVVSRWIERASRLAALSTVAAKAKQLSGQEDYAVCVESSMRKIAGYEAYYGEPVRRAERQLRQS